LRSLTTETGADPAGAACVVLGAGGAARAVVRALADAGAARVVVVNRTPDRGTGAAALAGAVGSALPGAEGAAVAAAVRSADLVVNATSVGMAGGGGEAGTLPLDPADLRSGQVVADLVYQPRETALLAAAAAAGATPLGGLGMLVHQAAEAFELWTGRPAPVAVMRAAAER
jgi:shikimate dehydrogenase